MKITIQAYTPLERGRILEHATLKKISSQLRRSPVQIALNYLISQDNVIAIPKGEKVSHVKEFIKSMKWRPSKSEIEIITYGLD